MEHEYFFAFLLQNRPLGAINYGLYQVAGSVSWPVQQRVFEFLNDASFLREVSLSITSWLLPTM